MPYRRTPTTDVSRLKVLKLAYEKAALLNFKDLPFSAETLRNLQNILLKFEQLYNLKKQNKLNKVQKNKELQKIFKKIKLYIIHYFKVINFGIQRGELPKHIRTFYKLDPENFNLPIIKNAKDVEHWVNTIIKGEKERYLKTNKILTTFPSIPSIKIVFDEFQKTYQQYIASKKNYEHYANKINEMREFIDKFIVSLWNEIENNFKNLDIEEKRKMASLFGVVYVKRNKEKQNSKNCITDEI